MATNSNDAAPAVDATPAAPAPADNQLYTLEAAIKLIAQSMAQQTQIQEQVAANTPKRRRTMEEYLVDFPEKRLLHDTFQNGRPVSAAGLSAATIRLLDTLAPGVYADGLVSVARIKEGPDGVNSRIHLFYSNKELGQRMNFYMRFPTFTSIVKTIAEEMIVLGREPVMDATGVDLAPIEAAEAKAAAEKKTKK